MKHAVFNSFVYGVDHRNGFPSLVWRNSTGLHEPCPHPHRTLLGLTGTPTVSQTLTQHHQCFCLTGNSCSQVQHLVESLDLGVYFKGTTIESKTNHASCSEHEWDCEKLFKVSTDQPVIKPVSDCVNEPIRVYRCSSIDQSLVFPSWRVTSKRKRQCAVLDSN